MYTALHDTHTESDTGTSGAGRLGSRPPRPQAGAAPGGAAPPQQSMAGEGQAGRPAAPDLQPTALVARSSRQPPSPHLKTYEADSDGQLMIRSRPNCVMTCFMCPFPFFCLGCCTSSSTNAEFDDRSQHITWTRWPGHCCCCRSRAHIPYADVANVVFQSTNMSFNDELAYEIAIATKTGPEQRYRYVISEPQVQNSEHVAKLLGIHRFLFGRAHPEQYRPPSVHSITEY